MELTSAVTTNQKELVKLLYLEHGHQRASEISGVRYDLVRKWASLGKWKHIHKASQSPVAVAVDNVAAQLQEHERKTKLGLATYASKQAQSAADKGTMQDSANVHNVARTAAIVHRWDAKSENTQNVVVNVALLGVQPAEISATVCNVDSEGQDSGD